MLVRAAGAGRMGSRRCGSRRRWTAFLSVRLLVFLTLAAGAVFNQSAVHWRPNIIDDYLFGYHGWCVSQGARPYLDIWDNKPPGIWWLNAAVFRLLGSGIEPELALGSAAVLVSMVAFIGIARTVYRRSLLVPATLAAVVLLTHHTFECGGNRTETYVLACETLGVWGYVRWLRRGRPVALFLGGIAAGAAPLFKQVGFAAAVAIVLHLAWVQWRSRGAPTPYRFCKAWGSLAAGLLLPTVTAGTVLAAQGALGEALFAVGRFNRVYFAVGEATLWDTARVVMSYASYVRVLAPALLVAGGGLLMAAWVAWLQRGARARPRRGVGVFVVWLLLAFYLACIGPGRHAYYLMPILPAVGLLLLLPVHMLAGRRGLRRRLTASPGTLGLVVAWGYLLVALLGASVHEAERGWRVKPHWYALQRREPAAWEAQGAEIARVTPPEELIYVCGWSPGTYRYACRRPASRFATFEKLGQVGQHADFILREARADLYRRRPRALVMAVGEWEGVRAHPDETFADWVLAHYRLHSEVQGMVILLRAD